MSLDAAAAAETRSETLNLRVARMEWVATDILEVELRAPAGGELPAYEPGAHVDLHLPNGLIRSYSIKGDPEQRDRYVVGVGRDAASRGGSVYVHDKLRVGEIVPVSAPRNNFPLAEEAPLSVLIAGGIGVTPLVCMARRLSRLGRACIFHYAVRSADRAAFLDELGAMGIDLRLHVDAEAGGPLDMAAALAGHPEGTHVYCCGPSGMMQAFEAGTEGWPEDNVHVEYFTPKVVEAPADAVEGPFTVECRKSGKMVEVAPDVSIADALRAAGVSVDTSCEDGICGTCETRVIEGTPDHRDSILTKKEREANRTMMVCVSRSKGGRLVLDI